MSAQIVTIMGTIHMGIGGGAGLVVIFGGASLNAAVCSAGFMIGGAILIAAGVR